MEDAAFIFASRIAEKMEGQNTKSKFNECFELIKNEPGVTNDPVFKEKLWRLAQGAIANYKRNRDYTN